MAYLDTSVLIALFTNEPAADRVRPWLRKQPAGSLAISLWTITEFSYVLALKVRTQQIDLTQSAAAQSAFNRLTTKSMRILPVNDLHFITAARFIERQNVSLRAADGLHLAVAFQAGETVITLDAGLAEACRIIGALVEIP
jgi:predicted nucleic acid-binding protein